MNEPTIEALAAVLGAAQSNLIRSRADTLEITQVGAAVLPDPFPVAVPDPGDPVVPTDGESVIETFVGTGVRSLQPTGGDRAVADWWQPAVDALVAEVTSALVPFGMAPGGLISVTASTTPLDQVITEPHLDDDQYAPEAGVGLVAIAASHDGPRLARGVLTVRRAVSGAPLGLDPEALVSWFAKGDLDRVQDTPADRVVLFPRFGQLHAGPVRATDGSTGHGVRSLLVLRCDTVVAGQARSGSGPT